MVVRSFWRIFRFFVVGASSRTVLLDSTPASYGRKQIRRAENVRVPSKPVRSPVLFVERQAPALHRAEYRKRPHGGRSKSPGPLGPYSRAFRGLALRSGHRWILVHSGESEGRE